MELAGTLSLEQMPGSAGGGSVVSRLSSAALGLGPENEAAITKFSEEEISEKLETLLLERIQKGDRDAIFQLGQLYYEQCNFKESLKFFERAAEKGDYQAMFQAAVIYYDALAEQMDEKKGFEYMMKVATNSTKKFQHMVNAAQYNVGRAYFCGYGVRTSEEDAEKWWLMAADDGNPKASIKAQSVLGLFYSRPDTLDLKKAFFWHSEACGNGSLESQGALGVMYLHGIGTRQDPSSAFVCLREAAERGNVYAMGNLIGIYYQRKLFTKCVELSARVAQYDNVDSIALETDCLSGFVAKGIAMACFYYARCLHQGHGVKRNEDQAKLFYSRSCHFDPQVSLLLQKRTAHGHI